MDELFVEAFGNISYGGSNCRGCKYRSFQKLQVCILSIIMMKSFHLWNVEKGAEGADD